MKTFGQGALALQQAGLYRVAEASAAMDLAAAERAGDSERVIRAYTRRLSIALDCDRPQPAIHWGTRALPLALGSRPAKPETRARLYVHLAKAAWELGLERDMEAYVDAARTVVEHESVSVVTQIHYRLTAGVAAASAEGDIALAQDLTVDALELARTIGDARMEAACRQNLCYLAVRAGAFAEAETWIQTFLDAGMPDRDLVEVMGDGVRTALAFGDLRLAGTRLRRLLNGYMEAPSRLSPVALGYLFEVLGAYYAHRGLLEAAASLWSSAAGWFRRRGHIQNAERMERGVAELRPGPAMEQPAIDPDLLYLGRLFTAARGDDESQDSDFQVALAVNRVLPEIAPAAEPVATEHAAMLRPFQPVARLFAARSSAGRAAVRVLTGEDEPARAALDVLAAYERLCATGLSWPAVIRSMRSARLAPEPVRALDRLYQELIA